MTHTFNPLCAFGVSWSRSQHPPFPAPDCPRLSGKDGTFYFQIWQCLCATWHCLPCCTWPGCSQLACTCGVHPFLQCQRSIVASSHRWQSCHRPVSTKTVDVGNCLLLHLFIHNISKHVSSCLLISVLSFQKCSPGR